MRLTGLLVVAMQHVRWGRAHVHPFVLHLNATFFGNPAVQQALSAGRPLRRLLDRGASIPAHLVVEARWWTVDRLTFGRPLGVPNFDLFLGTDASLSGWGAHLSQGVCTWEVSGSWLMDPLPSINVLEFQAVTLAVQHWLQTLANQRVLLATDNTAVVAYVNHLGGTKSRAMHEQAQLLASLLEAHQILLTASYIPGRENVLADSLSRQSTPPSTEWQLAPRVAKLLFRKWGTPFLDAFASARNHQLGVYCTLHPDPGALARDAFSLDWSHRFLYLYPPSNPKFLLRVLTKLHQSPGASAILVAPHHPNAMFFSLLTQLLVHEPFQLPTYPDLLSQGSILHPNPGWCNLHGYRLYVPC
jgi:hypothetical protein